MACNIRNTSSEQIQTARDPFYEIEQRNFINGFPPPASKLSRYMRDLKDIAQVVKINHLHESVQDARFCTLREY